MYSAGSFPGISSSPASILDHRLDPMNMFASRDVQENVPRVPRDMLRMGGADMTVNAVVGSSAMMEEGHNLYGEYGVVGSYKGCRLTGNTTGGVNQAENPARLGWVEFAV